MLAVDPFTALRTLGQLLVCTGALVAVGCGSSGSTGPGAASPRAAAEPSDASSNARSAQLAHLRQQRCDALCARAEACGAPNASRCRSDCPSEATSDLAHVRPEYGWKLTACLDGTDCRSLLAGKAEPACEAYAREQLQPTPLLRSFCFDSSKRAAQCHQPADQSDCLDRYRSLDDASLQAAQKCLERTCAEVPGCFAQSFGYSNPGPVPP